MTVEEKVAAIASEWLGKPVHRLVASGADWVGDTESGFFEQFEVVLHGADEDGVPFYYEVGGTELKSLWDFVMTRVVDE